MKDTKEGTRKWDQPFFDIYSNLLKKIGSNPQHNREPNVFEFSTTLIWAITAGYLPQIVHVNANRVNDADYGLINYEKNISVHTLAEGIRCWWRTTSTGRAATSLRRTCPSCAWPLQRGPHHPADPLLVPGGLLCRGVKWTRGVRRRRGTGGGVQILAPARRQIHPPCVLSPPAVHVQSPVSRSTGALTPDAAAAPAAVCWSTPAGWIEGGKIASG